jgi:hypothetical protein
LVDDGLAQFPVLLPATGGQWFRDAVSADPTLWASSRDLFAAWHRAAHAGHAANARTVKQLHALASAGIVAQRKHRPCFADWPADVWVNNTAVFLRRPSAEAQRRLLLGATITECPWLAELEAAIFRDEETQTGTRSPLGGLSLPCSAGATSTGAPEEDDVTQAGACQRAAIETAAKRLGTFKAKLFGVSEEVTVRVLEEASDFVQVILEPNNARAVATEMLQQITTQVTDASRRKDALPRATSKRRGVLSATGDDAPPLHGRAPAFTSLLRETIKKRVPSGGTTGFRPTSSAVGVRPAGAQQSTKSGKQSGRVPAVDANDAARGERVLGEHPEDIEAWRSVDHMAGYAFIHVTLFYHDVAMAHVIRNQCAEPAAPSIRHVDQAKGAFCRGLAHAAVCVTLLVTSIGTVEHCMGAQIKLDCSNELRSRAILAAWAEVRRELLSALVLTLNLLRMPCLMIAKYFRNTSPYDQFNGYQARVPLPQTID